MEHEIDDSKCDFVNIQKMLESDVFALTRHFSDFYLLEFLSENVNNVYELSVLKSTVVLSNLSINTPDQHLSTSN